MLNASALTQKVGGFFKPSSKGLLVFFGQGLGLSWSSHALWLHKLAESGDPAHGSFLRAGFSSSVSTLSHQTPGKHSVLCWQQDDEMLTPTIWVCLYPPDEGLPLSTPPAASGTQVR